MVSAKITFLFDGNRPLITSSPCFHDEEQFDGGRTVMCYVFPFCVKGFKSRRKKRFFANVDLRP